MLAVAIILPNFKKDFALVFYEKKNCLVFKISYMYLPNNDTIHLCINMTKMYTFYQF